jgi:hypothetical protein
MGRLLVAVALVAGVAFLGLLWLNRGFFAHVEERDAMLDEERRDALARRRSQVPAALPPAARPRGSHDRLLEIRLAAASPDRRTGGPVLFSLRGNQVVYARRSLERPEYVQAILDLAAVDRILLEARRGAPGGTPELEVLVLGADERTLGEQRWPRDGTLERIRSWVPAGQRFQAQALRIEGEVLDPGSAPAEAAEWPRWPGSFVPPASGDFETEIRAPPEVTARILDLWGSPAIRATQAGTVFRLTSVEVLLP